MRSEGEIVERVLAVAGADDAVRAVIRTDILPVREYLYTYKKLLDKDGALPDIERLEERQTLFSGVPSEAEFANACDEFWWVMKTFAEYTLRRELPAAMFYLNVAVRDLLNRLLRWHIRLREGKPVDMGILDSNLEKLLEEEWFALYRRTYPTADYGRVWEAFDAVAALWSRVGNGIAERCGFSYPRDTEGDMLAFIRNLREQRAGRDI